MKHQGGFALDQAISGGNLVAVQALVVEFLRLRAGQRILKDRGVSLAAVNNHDVGHIIALLETAGAVLAMPSSDLPSHFQLAPASADIDCADMESIASLSEIGSDGSKLDDIDDEEHSMKSSRGGEHCKGAGKGHRCRPPRQILQQWADGLSQHSKFLGISTERYRGMEFKRVLKDEVVAAGLGTKPSELRPHRTLPTKLNRVASQLCSEAGTQATCECHSAGLVKLEPRVQTFLSECIANGLLRINVVTGLGTHGGGGTVRQVMPELLQANIKVQSFQVASNFSAFYVNLLPLRL